MLKCKFRCAKQLRIFDLVDDARSDASPIQGDIFMELIATIQSDDTIRYRKWNNDVYRLNPRHFDWKWARNVSHIQPITPRHATPLHSTPLQLSIPSNKWRTLKASNLNRYIARFEIGLVPKNPYSSQFIRHFRLSNAWQRGNYTS